MKSNETKTYGSIRKIKAYGTCGVILGLAALAVATTNGVQADEVAKTEPTTVAPANTATNLPDSQPAKTAEQQNQLNQAGQAQGNVTVQVDNSQVNQAAQAAQKEGVKVVQDAPVDKGTTNTLAETQKAQAEIAADQAKQKAAVEKTTEDYVKAKEDHKKAVEETKQANAKINADNTALKEAHDKAEEAGQDVNRAVSTAKDKVKAEFKDAKVSESSKTIKVEATKDSYDAYTKEVEKVKSENQKAIDIYVEEKRKEDKDIADTKAYNEEVRKRNTKRKDEVDAENDKIADFNKKVSQHNQAEDDRVAAEKAQAEKDKTKDGYLSQASVQNLIYNSEPNATFEVLTLNSGYQALSSDDKRYEPQEKIAQGKFVGTVNLKQGKSIQVKYSNLQNSSYNGKKISSVVLTYTNKTKDPSPKADLGMAFFKDPTKTFWLFTTTNSDTIPTEVGIDLEFFDDKGQKISLTKDEALIGLASLNNDTIANGANAKRSSVEQVRVDNGEVIEITGSSVKAHGNVAYADTDNHFKSAGSKFEQDDWDTGTSKNRYYGSAVAKFKNTDKISLTSISYKRPTVWLAINSEIAVPKVPTPPRYQEPKTPVEFKPEPEKPVPTPKAKLSLVTVNGVPTPTYKPTEKLPTPPVVPTVHVHDYKLSTRPQVQKAVENADKVNVNGQYVAKNSLNRFVLQTETLPAGRKPITQLVFNDHLPQGFKVDLEKTKEANKGYEVAYNEKANLLTFKATTATLTSVNKDLAKEYKLADLSVWGRPQNDAADYENVFEMVVNGGGSNGYVRKSNKVLIHTPGKPDPNKPNDPKNPNRDPLKPEKHNYNEQGKLVDGKEMLPEGINYYVSKWTNRPNKGDKSGKEAIAKGFAYIEDYQDDAVTPLESRFQVKDAQGKAVNGLKMYHVLDRKTLSKALNDMIDRSGISPKGAFYMWVAEKPEEFYKAYVQTGMDLYFHTPMQIGQGFTGKYTNQTFQVQFGNGYYSNVVVNHVPELKVQKQVYNKLGDGQNLDGKLVKLGDKFYYFLDGAKLPANRGEALKEYRFFDDFDQKGDEFTGEYKALAGVDIKLKDGSVIKAGTDLSQYAELKYNKAKGVVEISMKQDFLDKVDNASEFDVDAAIQMKRIAAGTFENTYKNVVNGHEIVSNTVKTSTPTPEPEKPQPKKPTPAPKTPAPALPQTGTASGIGLSVLGMILAGFGLFGLKKHKEN
ncbi:SspB-related isopeptide-forming adhesin [Streptococcus anginosus]|uniref:SspB-related isopeptide-forming adhesin n=1 Tax=Streptococcus anginosus TaxID=1328 RepID=UPI0022E0A505|nr:SspB-related isopeptide-forming adhesin [Streptococcus anginosus]